MKALKQMTRPVSLLVAAMVVAATFVCAQRATAYTTVPNEAQIPYNLAAGAVSSPITPVANLPVMLMGVCTTVNYRGVGHASILRIAGSTGFIEWSGINSPSSGTVTAGYSSTTGTDILKIDYSAQVIVEVVNPDRIQVNNTASATRTGYVTLIW